MPPTTAATLRFIPASIILLSALLIRDKKLQLLTIKEWGAMALLGLTGVLAYNIFFFTGLQTVEAGRASMIIAINPVITAYLTMFLFGKHFDIQRFFWNGTLCMWSIYIYIKRPNSNYFSGHRRGKWVNFI